MSEEEGLSEREGLGGRFKFGLGGSPFAGFFKAGDSAFTSTGVFVAASASAIGASFCDFAVPLPLTSPSVVSRKATVLESCKVALSSSLDSCLIVTAAVVDAA